MKNVVTSSGQAAAMATRPAPSSRAAWTKPKAVLEAGRPALRARVAIWLWAPAQP